MKIDFFLDSLFYSLIIICILLLYRLVRSRLLHKHRARNLHAVLLPIEVDSNGEVELKYELPFDSHVRIEFLDASETPTQELLNKSQSAGNYYLKVVVERPSEVAFVRFSTDDTKVLRRFTLPAA